ncbi:unnamed protein product [Adineta steineri]|uniref:Uncharacterized protein n=1 Tax=Adineta steineri TaxID=433720 RepID=A0A818NA01_9BILA|nr:unnamed protein product [Adineta steineri]
MIYHQPLTIVDKHICCDTATGTNAGFNHAGRQAKIGQTIKLGGTTLYVGNFQAAFKNPTGVGVPPVDDEKRGVPSTDEDGLGALRADEGKF